MKKTHILTDIIIIVLIISNLSLLHQLNAMNTRLDETNSKMEELHKDILYDKEQINDLWQSIYALDEEYVLVYSELFNNRGE